ncbi:MAG: dihydropteroate synthase [Candidatus Eremiobacteraeota bacterium]|nr:dihydropteroate synthase [Candidatus Eremiobacteraeota bacterium]
MSRGALGRAARGTVLRLRERVLDLSDEAAVMGIVNVTPDSFYDRVAGVRGAVARARTMAAVGATLIDVGGRSYARWNRPVSAEEEARRVVPAVRAIAAAETGALVSVDTTHAAVAEKVFAAGAHLINDCSGLADPEMAQTVARYGAGLVVMHLSGGLNGVGNTGRRRYDDVVAEVVAFLHDATERAVAAGVARDAIVVDPGLEFGKEPADDLRLLERFGELRALRYPVLFAASRKTFLGRIFGRPPSGLLVPSLAAAAMGVLAGARLVRTHDVAETVDLVRMLAAPKRAREGTLRLNDTVAVRPSEAGDDTGNSHGAAAV